MKTRFKTHDNAQIDPISHRIKGFSFHAFKVDHWHSRINFFLFSQQTLTFKHSLEVEIDIEAKGSKRVKDCGV